VLVTVGLTLARNDLGGLGNLFREDQPSATSREPSSSTTAERVKVADADSFDPEGDDQQENSDEAELAIDGDRTTSWRTEGYDQNFGRGGIKKGVGLVLDLGRPQEVAKMVLTLDPTGGSQVAIYGTDDPEPSSLEDWTRLADPKPAQDKVTFGLEGSHRYLLIWFTSLPQDEGKFRGGVANVSLTS
jgi:hypothetical protein